MEKSIKWLEGIGLLFSLIFSFVFHSMYEWIGTLGFIFPISESVWEHIKILVMPYLLYAIIEYFILKPRDTFNYFSIKAISIIIMPVIMIILFYTYSGIIGINYIAVDVIIGILSIGIGYIISYKLLSVDYKVKRKTPIIISSVILLLMIVIFTYFPPNINLFLEK